MSASIMIVGLIAVPDILRVPAEAVTHMKSFFLLPSHHCEKFGLEDVEGSTETRFLERLRGTGWKPGTAANRSSVESSLDNLVRRGSYDDCEMGAEGAARKPTPLAARLSELRAVLSADWRASLQNHFFFRFMLPEDVISLIAVPPRPIGAFTERAFFLAITWSCADSPEISCGG